MPLAVNGQSIARRSFACIAAVCVLSACDVVIDVGQTPSTDVTRPDARVPLDTASSAPRILVHEGQTVPPQTLLHLEGLWPEASASDDPPVRWTWSVEQPGGSVSRLLPSADAPTPTFEANVVGTYVVHLRMSTLTKRHVECTLTVEVVADAELHVELSWRTPKDLDESDTGVYLNGHSVGSDLDLHALLLGGEHAWFDHKYDCYFDNDHPKWASVRASLDRDDTDGGGPENLNATTGAESWCLRLGVHYWHDARFGPALATVRVYRHAALIHETHATLAPHELWHVADVCSDGSVTPGSSITSDYPVPFD